MSNLRQCWICRVEEDMSKDEGWLEPCKCKGSARWVHHECLLAWINAQLASQRSRSQLNLAVGPLISPAVACPQCHFQYQIQDQYILPRPFLSVVDTLRRWKNRLVLVSAVSCLSAGLYLL